jgi:uncharacterized membrane protein YgcG
MSAIRALLVCGLAAAALTPPNARALALQERILSYDSQVEIQPDGGMYVTERIRVRAEGQQIRRGITRDFPTRYRDRYGNQVRVDFDVLGVERNGEPEPWFTERMGNGIRLNTGNDDFLPVPADYTFTIRFRTNRQLGFFEDHDELYWNAIGTGSIFPIERGSVEVRLPARVPVDSLGAEGYTGPQGARGSGYVAELPEPGLARYRLTQALAPHEGFTIVLTFPKGLVAEPTGARRAGWLLRDNRGVLIAAAGLLAVLLFCVLEWRRIGRDPRKGIIIPRYEPRPGFSPASMRYMRRTSYDTRCFSSDVLTLAVAGHLRIHREKKMFGEKWRMERTVPQAAAPASATTVAAAAQPASSVGATSTTTATVASSRPTHLGSGPLVLLDQLFPPGKSSIELDKRNASALSQAQHAHQRKLDAELHPRYFKRNARSVLFAVLIAAPAIWAAFALSGDYGLPAIIAITVITVITLVVFARLIGAPTPEGRALLDEIEGLKLYLGVAEKQDLARMPGPDGPPLLDARRFEALLPFAVALEVEDAWTKKFTAAVGAAAAAAATAQMAWYSGRGPITDIGAFSRAVGSSLTSQISSASTPPGAKSGSGGGGSSGGGGGGGGVGGR